MICSWLLNKTCASPTIIGELGGDAIYDVLFGNLSPAGKLPVTIYDENLIRNRPHISDMNLRDNGGITYRYYKGTPVYPFGYGLSYTTFEYKWNNYNSNYDYDNKSQGKRITTDKMAHYYFNKQYFYNAIEFDVNVKNTGNMASDCVVLGFVSSNDTDSPMKKLFDFQRVFIQVGQSVNVTLSVSPESISLTNKHGDERIIPGIYKIQIGETQNFVETTLTMTGNQQTIFKMKHWMKIQQNTFSCPLNCTVLNGKLLESITKNEEAGSQSMISMCSSSWKMIGDLLWSAKNFVFLAF